MPERVVVRVPATSANLGPGYDCLGLALSLTADVGVALQPQAPSMHGLASMVAVAVRAAYRAAGRPEPAEVGVDWQGDLPAARGLGASAAARAAGLVAANALMEGALTVGEMLGVGAELEGHADNIAPALLGGLQVVVRDDDAWVHLGVPLAEGLTVVLLVPDFEMPTREGRKRLPQRLTREDAVFNVGRATMLVAALAQGRWDVLEFATQDRLHQPVRGEVFPALEEIIEAAKDGGAHAAYLSGAGSTVAAFTTDGEERIARLMQQAAVARGYGATTLTAKPSADGATVIDG